VNVRQSGAFGEIIRKEEAAQNRWACENTATYNNYTSETPSEYQQDDYYDRYEDNRLDNAETIYDNALRISSPRLIDDGSEIPQFVQRKVVRQVEVPFVRQVKVPVKTRKILPIKVQKRVKTTKLVEVPAFKMVDETYTDIVEQPAIREKEVWVKKIVPEKYMQKVPVKRSRRVKVPTTVIQEVDDWEVVEVNGSKAVEVDGYRVDDVEDSKLVEVEEFQTYKLEPTAYGPARIDNAYDIGNVEGVHHSRKIGSQVYHANDHRVDHVPVDQVPDDFARMSLNQSRGYNRPRSATARRGSRNDHRAQQSRSHSTKYQRPSSARSQAPLGVKLSDTASHNCISVTQVTSGSAAESAGVRRGDLISYANNKPTRNLKEFRDAVSNSRGHINLQVRRLGGVKLTLIVAR
jgi:hypothetical protein